LRDSHKLVEKNAQARGKIMDTFLKEIMSTADLSAESASLLQQIMDLVGQSCARVREISEMMQASPEK
jgi:hypothetical protein